MGSHTTVTDLRKWRKAHPENVREHNRRSRAKLSPESREKMRCAQKAWAVRLKIAAITHYGGKCACCGEKCLEFLTIDHVNGGGRKHRKKVNGHFYRWLEKAGYPDDGRFRVLCFNCNHAYRFGSCPHQRGEPICQIVQHLEHLNSNLMTVAL